MINTKINGVATSINSDGQQPLLWVLREELQLTGTKFGCGLGQCGACTVLVEGQPIRSCVTPVAAVANKSINTIESLSAESAVVKAWRELSVPQCGYCQSGQMMAATALLDQHPKPDDKQVETAMDRQLCRCGTYPKIRQAIERAANILDGETS